LTLADNFNENTPKRLPVVYLENAEYRNVNESYTYVVVEIPTMRQVFDISAVFMMIFAAGLDYVYSMEMEILSG